MRVRYWLRLHSHSGPLALRWNRSRAIEWSERQISGERAASVRQKNMVITSTEEWVKFKETVYYVNLTLTLMSAHIARCKIWKLRWWLVNHTMHALKYFSLFLVEWGINLSIPCRSHHAWWMCSYRRRWRVFPSNMTDVRRCRMPDELCPQAQKATTNLEVDYWYQYFP